MNLPDLQGTCNRQDFFIYAACDRQYFDLFGRTFINSIRNNSAMDVHIHLFNPGPEQIHHCQTNNVGVTWEFAPDSIFKNSADRWKSLPIDEPAKSHYARTITAMGKGQDANVLERMQKTYYACARFVRLADLFCKKTVLAVDIDAVIRKTPQALSDTYDFYLHHIAGKRARYLAGGLWLNPTDNSKKFLKEYADQLVTYLNNDYIYWGLDQDLLDPIVPKYNHGQLPVEYIDWNMQPDSYIWTAKGTRKDLVIFVNEQKKYIA